MRQHEKAAHPAFLRDLHQHLLEPDSPVYEAMGWEPADLPRILNGELSVTVDKIPALVSAAGYVLVSKRLNDAIWTMAQAGSAEWLVALAAQVAKSRTAEHPTAGDTAAQGPTTPTAPVPHSTDKRQNS